MRVIAIIQARLGSTRLPRKALLPIGGKPMIQHVIERVRRCQRLDGVILATTILAEDDELCAVAGETGIQIVRPECAPNDVLSRMTMAARLTRADVIMRITGDCPLWDAAVGTFALFQFLDSGVSYLTNDTTVSGWPDGYDVQIFSREALEEACKRATDSSDREHVCPWMERNVLTLKLMKPYWWPVVPTEKLSVDTPEDWERAQRHHEEDI